MKLRIYEYPPHKKVGRISESVEKIDDILVFDYVGDVVNLLLNKPRPYRICYDPQNDVYGVGDAYKYIHGFIEKGMRQLGYIISETTGHAYSECTFVPYDVKDDKWQAGGFVGEREKPIYLPTGFLLFNKVVSPEDEMPDLFTVLERRNLISKKLDDRQIERIKRTALTRLQDTYNRFYDIVDIMEQNGFKLVDKDFRGRKFKTYSDYMQANPKAWGVDFRRFNELFVDTVPGRKMDPDDVYVGEGDDQSSVYWMYVDVMSSQSAIFKEIISLCKEYNIPYSTFYDIDRR